jgi:hypothetical protein
VVDDDDEDEDDRGTHSRGPPKHERSPAQAHTALWDLSGQSGNTTPALRALKLDFAFAYRHLASLLPGLHDPARLQEALRAGPDDTTDVDTLVAALVVELCSGVLDRMRLAAVKVANIEVKSITARIHANRPTIIATSSAECDPNAAFYGCAACKVTMRQSSDCVYSRHGLTDMAPLSYSSILEAADDSPAHSPAAASFTAGRLKHIAAARLVHDAVTGLPCDLAFSYYQKPVSGNYFHLKRQYVDPAGVYNDVHHDEPSALLCPSCAASLKPNAKLPSHCIARGMDLGHLRAVLTDWTHGLTRLERMAIAPVRLYMMVIKFAGRNAGSGPATTMRGHCIAFYQNSAPNDVVQEADRLPRLDVHTAVSIVFVGPKKQFEARLSLALPFGSVTATRYQLLVRIVKLQHALGNPLFQRYTDVDESPEANAYFTGDKDAPGSLQNLIVTAATCISDESVCDVDVVTSAAPANALGPSGDALDEDSRKIGA